ncbi:MAG TPA: site-specific DNA-methyltransferase [Bryobacteraceae bacterium]|jgi:site-specific DNA-methyltransferase (adenine-specific)|nr:site-specific DNA-methyltransferase [Bryobacteraceae bacterium]
MNTAIAHSQNFPLNRIYQMDCLEGMKLLPPRSIDLILCDLPYGKTANRWDSVIDLDRLWREYKRLIRRRGAIVLTAQCPFDKVLGMSNRNWFRYEWIWEKSRATGFYHAKRAPLKAHENVLVFCQHCPVYHPQLATGKPYVSSRKGYFYRNLGKPVRPVDTRNDGYRYPRSVLRIASEPRTFHPTQKPLALFEYLIRTYSNPGDVVLDNCMGSGTTAVACMNTGRNFIGFELDKDYHRYAEQRIRLTRQELKLL